MDGKIYVLQTVNIRGLEWLLLSNKVYLKMKRIRRDEEDFIMIEGHILQEDITIILWICL